MSGPRKDATGRTIPYDDEDIGPDDGLIRYIDPEHHIAWDEDIQAGRLSSAAFSESSIDGALSVDLQRKMAMDGLDAIGRIPQEAGWGAVRLKASDPRALNLFVGSDPIEDPDPEKANPYHGSIWCIRGRKKIRRKLCELATWIRKAEGVP